LGHPSKFQRLSRLGSVTVRYSSSGHQPNFAVLNRGRLLYSAGRPSRWSLAHILVSSKLNSKLIKLIVVSANVDSETSQIRLLLSTVRVYQLHIIAFTDRSRL